MVKGGALVEGLKQRRNNFLIRINVVNAKIQVADSVNLIMDLQRVKVVAVLLMTIYGLVLKLIHLENNIPFRSMFACIMQKKQNNNVA